MLDQSIPVGFDLTLLWVFTWRQIRYTCRRKFVERQFPPASIQYKINPKNVVYHSSQFIILPLVLIVLIQLLHLFLHYFGTSWLILYCWVILFKSILIFYDTCIPFVLTWIYIVFHDLLSLPLCCNFCTIDMPFASTVFSLACCSYHVVETLIICHSPIHTLIVFLSLFLGYFSSFFSSFRMAIKKGKGKSFSMGQQTSPSAQSLEKSIRWSNPPTCIS